MHTRALRLSLVILPLLAALLVTFSTFLLNGHTWLGALIAGLLTAMFIILATNWLLHAIRQEFTALVSTAHHHSQEDAASLPTFPKQALPGLQDLVTTFNQLMHSFHERHIALQQERDDLIAALSAVGEGVAIISEHNTLTYANPPLWSISATLSHTPQNTASPEDLLSLDGLPEAVERALAGKSATCTITTDHGEAYFQVRTLPLTHNATPPRAAIIFHDLSEAQRLDRVRQEFVANASHELLTPIGTVRALADSLARGGLDDPKVTKRFFRQLRIEADRLATLARELLELTQAQADELRLELSPTNVNTVVQTVIDRLTPQADTAHISLSTKLNDHEPLALADATRLEQVLVNLIQNALKFTPKNGTITIETEDRDSDVIIRVHDNGIGIPAQDLPRIFERFYKVRGVAPGPSGTGLGLAIVRHLVRAMQGEVWAESQLGKGSTFFVLLQRAHATLEQVPPGEFLLEDRTEDEKTPSEQEQQLETSEKHHRKRRPSDHTH